MIMMTTQLIMMNIDGLDHEDGDKEDDRMDNGSDDR